MKHLILLEDMTVDPLTGNNSVFSVKLRSLSDLSNKKADRLPAKQKDDALDDFQEGDIISGKGVDDRDEHQGSVISIKKDDEGMNLEITIEENGKLIKLVPSSAKFADEYGEHGNRESAPFDSDTVNPNNDVVPFSFEQKTELRNLKSL